MLFSQILADRVRSALSHLDDVQEKKMFGSIAFMVNGKMCITAGKGRIMCRIDPLIQADMVYEQGIKPVIMKGRELKGYIHVEEKYLRTKKQFDRWIELVLDYNSVARASKKK
jgi:TfoX/Sxy family transcriptional regulator of competence genes